MIGGSWSFSVEKNHEFSIAKSPDWIAKSPDCSDCICDVFFVVSRVANGRWTLVLMCCGKFGRPHWFFWWLKSADLERAVVATFRFPVLIFSDSMLFVHVFFPHFWALLFHFLLGIIDEEMMMMMMMMMMRMRMRMRMRTTTTTTTTTRRRRRRMMMMMVRNDRTISHWGGRIPLRCGVNRAVSSHFHAKAMQLLTAQLWCWGKQLHN